ncbi:MAG: ABC transporter permease [Bryobacterales bacterium]|nr:ABC transporter permease [Bryobacterales bacterium]
MTWREWLAGTHPQRFELVRHFLPSFFESELISSRGQLTRIAAGAASILLSSWMLLFVLLRFKYQTLADMNLHTRMAVESTNDLLALTSVCMCLTSLLAAVLWQSIYPSRRDFLAMAGWPVQPADLFLAKFVSLAVTFGAFLIVFPLPVIVLLATITAAPFTVTAGTILVSVTTLFFAAIAIQGVLLNVLGPRAFERAMIWTQALLAAAGVGGIPIAFWKGHILLRGLTPSVWHAAAALSLSVVIYILSFQRYRTLVMESAATRPASPTALWRWVGNPQEQAVLDFFWATITRSRVHRLAVLCYAALALSWLSKSLVELMAESREIDRMVFTVFPLFLLLATIFGLRHLFSIPVEIQANWVFQMNERFGRQAWLRATEKFVYCVGVLPVLALGCVLVSRQSGLLVGMAWAAMALGIAAIAFERLFRHWRKLPFTCTYLPGKRPVLITAALFVLSIPCFLMIAFIAHSAAANPASVLILLALEYVIWRSLRNTRLRFWGMEPMSFVEVEESAVDTYDLSGEGTVLAQERFQQEWRSLVLADGESPLVRPLDAHESWQRRLWDWLKDLPSDARFAMRALRRSPGFAATIVFTLSIGLGLNAAFFTLFNAFLLRPMAVRDPASLVSMHFETRSRDNVSLSMDDFESLKTAVSAFSGVAASTFEGTGLEGQAARYVLVTPNYFHLLGVPAFLGRTFYPGEDAQAVVLSHRAWVSRFGSDPGIVGRKVNLNGSIFEVIGVTPPEFAGVPVGTVAIAPPSIARYAVGVADCWLLFDAWSRLPGERAPVVAGVIGRLHPDATAHQAASMATGHVRRLTASRPEWQKLWRADVQSLDIPVTWTSITHSLPLVIAFGLTMLIPCANAANILLARATQRQREFGTRLALGATRGRVVRQLLTEGIALSALASFAGLIVARAALDLFLSFIYSTAPPTMLHRMRIPDLVVDSHVIVYMAAITMVTTLLFAMAPASQATRLSLTSALRGEFHGFRASSLRDWLMVTQVALCVMLLAGSALLLRGSLRALNIDRGFDAESVFAVTNQNPAHAAKLRSLLEPEPWVSTIAVMGRPRSEADAILVGATGAQPALSVYCHRGSGEIFRMFHQSITRGRTFTADESENLAPVAVITDTVASTLWPGEDPIGQVFHIGEAKPSIWVPRFREARVIGVTRDAVEKVKDEGPRPAVWFPDKLRFGTVLALRSKLPPRESRALLNQVFARAPGSAKGAWVISYQEAIDWETYPHQATTWLSGVLAASSLLITITGIYALIAFIVSQKRKEIGIRMALGADVRHVASLVSAYIARKVAIGLAAGIVLAVGALQFVQAHVPVFVDLFDIRAYLAGCAAVVLAAGLAMLGPTVRACKTDPQSGLRSD